MVKLCTYSCVPVYYYLRIKLKITHIIIFTAFKISLIGKTKHVYKCYVFQVKCVYTSYYSVSYS